MASGRLDNEVFDSNKAYHTVDIMKQADKGQALRIKDLKTQISAIKVKIGEQKKLITDYTAQNEILHLQLDNLPNDNPSLEQMMPLKENKENIELCNQYLKKLGKYSGVMNESCDQNKKKIVEKFKKMEKYFDLVDKCETMKIEREKELWNLRLSNRQPSADDSIQIVADHCSSPFIEQHHQDDEGMIAAEQMIVERSPVDLQPLLQTAKTATPTAKTPTVRCYSSDQPAPPPTVEIIEQTMFNVSPNTSACSSMFDTTNHDYMSFTAYLRTTVKSDEVCSLSRPSSP